MKLQNGFSVLMAVLVAITLSGVAHASALTGSIRDAARGVPVAGATVLVYSAKPRKGYGTVCPTCYADAGKRVTTDAGGNFSIGGLDNLLLFDLIIVAKGLMPRWYGGVDLREITGFVDIPLRPLPAPNPATTALGRVVDAKGEPVPFAPVELVGLDFGGDRPVIGNFPDGLAVAGADGQFELMIESSRELGGALPRSLIVQVHPHGMAPALHKIALGRTRQDLRVTPGATVTGRVVAQGKPVPNAQLMLLTPAQKADERYAPIYIGTDKDGRFSITNVPAAREWSLDATTDSGMGSVAARDVETPADGQTVDLGDVEIRKGSVLSGRVVLSDGKILPIGLRVSVASKAGGSRNAVLDDLGKFEFEGLSGSYQLVVPEVPGYRLKDPLPELSLEKNVKGVKITLEPAR